MSRNNIEPSFIKGAVEFSWSFPIGDYPFLKGIYNISPDMAKA